MVYGRACPGNFTALIRLVETGLPLPFGSIINQRNLLGIDNLCSAICACIEHPKSRDETFYVCDNEAISTPDLVRVIASELNRPARLFAFPVPVMVKLAQLFGQGRRISSLTESLQIDNSHPRHTLKWSPPKTLRQGIQDALA